MQFIDKQYMKTPFFGSRRMTETLKTAGYAVNRKRVRRLMRKMGVEAVYRKPRTSKPAPENKIYPYLLRGVTIDRPDQVWAADITYVPMRKGFLYLVAIIDWHSRFVLSWRLSNIDGDKLLHGSLGRRTGLQRARDLQYGSGRSIYKQRFHRRLGRQADSH